MQALTPLCNPSASDSANLDNVAELLVRTGTQPAEALMLLVPEAYRNHPDLTKTYPEVRGAPHPVTRGSATAAGTPGGGAALRNTQ